NNLNSTISNNPNLTPQQKQDLQNQIPQNIIKPQAPIINFLNKIQCIFIEDNGKYTYQGVIKNSEGKIFSISEKKISDK
ncbi:hypothetical protein LR002_01080, partial [Candidatus Gracilibacteria bacterium]|nr:hypothetical protein [Candidatus Gracilibacteria bacterium]